MMFILLPLCFPSRFCFFFNDTATTEIYTYCHTLSLHDALPILLVMASWGGLLGVLMAPALFAVLLLAYRRLYVQQRSEEHTSELQSLMRISYAVFCLKKKNRSP